MIRKCRKNYENIKALASVSSRKPTLHSGAKSEPIELETQLYDRIAEQRRAELAASTLEIIDKALCIDPQFKNGNSATLQNWVYRFMKIHSLSVRTRTRASQVTSTAAICTPAVLSSHNAAICQQHEQSTLLC